MRKTPIPDPRPDLNALVATTRALKQALELALGIRGQVGETNSETDRPQAALTRDDIRNAASYGELRDKLTNTTRQSAITEENPLGYATEDVVTGAVAAHETSEHPSVADGTVQANVSGAPAQPSAQTLSAILDVILGSTQGDLIVRGAAGWEVLAAGAAGQVLTAAGAGATPVWEDAGQTWTTLVNSADQSIPSTATYVDVTGLSFPMAANTTYRIRGELQAYVESTALQFAANGPAGAARIQIVSARGAYVPATAYDALFEDCGSQAYTQMRSFYGVIENGATAGTFSLRFRQSVANVNASTLYRGSILEYAVVA